MSPFPRTLEQHLYGDGPKRILALDGGGLRGVLTLGILRRIEQVLAERHGGGPDFRLCHYFDLVAGTSTGAIIAACIALGMSVEEIRARYFALGRNIFQKSFFRDGLVRAKYDATQLEAELKSVFGAGTTMRSPRLLTGLMVMLKRLDSGSPWPLSNNPRSKYFEAPDPNVIPNGNYPLWKVVRASTAAPSFFDSEMITIAEVPGSRPVLGEFVDGGVSPHNNPALQAFMFCTLQGYKLAWPTGADRIQLVSVGTGAKDPSVKLGGPSAAGALKSLLSLMDDCQSQVNLLLQWMSNSPTARTIDREIGDLCGDMLGGTPLLTYLRYDVDLSSKSVSQLKPSLSDAQIEALSAMDDPNNMDILLELGRRFADASVHPAHFGQVFDLAKTSR